MAKMEGEEERANHEITGCERIVSDHYQLIKSLVLPLKGKMIVSNDRATVSTCIQFIYGKVVTIWHVSQLSLSTVHDATTQHCDSAPNNGRGVAQERECAHQQDPRRLNLVLLASQLYP